MKDQLNAIMRQLHDDAIANGWHDHSPSVDEFVPAACSNLHAEVSELWEAHRSNTLFDPCDKASKMVALGIPGLTCIEEEFADILIRVMDDCGRLGVDIGRAVDAKARYNKTRGYKHGGKKV